MDEGRVLNQEQGLHVSLPMMPVWGCSGGGGAHQAQVGLLRKQVLSIYNPNTRELTTVIPGNLLCQTQRRAPGGQRRCGSMKSRLITLNVNPCNLREFIVITDVITNDPTLHLFRFHIIKLPAEERGQKSLQSTGIQHVTSRGKHFPFSLHSLNVFSFPFYSLFCAFEEWRCTPTCPFGSDLQG